MAGSAVRYEGAPGSPPWGDVRQALLMWGEVCAAAAVALAMRGPHGVHAALAVREAAGALRDLSAQLRPVAFDEAVVEAERSRAAGEALTAAGLMPPQRPRHLHSVS